MLTRHPPVEQVETPTKELPDDGTEAASTAQVKRYVIACLRDALAFAWARTRQAQRQYTLNFDRTMRTLPELEPGDEVFFDQPEWMSTAPCADVDEYTGNYRRLLPKTVDPFADVSATDDTVVINGDGIEKRISTDPVKRA